MSEMLVQVTAPHFCAGIVLTDGRVTTTAPILKWSVGWQRERLSAYFKSKGWRAAVVTSATPTAGPDASGRDERLAERIRRGFQ